MAPFPAGTPATIPLTVSAPPRYASPQNERIIAGSAIADTATSLLDPNPPNALPVSSPPRAWKNRGSAIR